MHKAKVALSVGSELHARPAHLITCCLYDFENDVNIKFIAPEWEMNIDGKLVIPNAVPRKEHNPFSILDLLSLSGLMGDCECSEFEITCIGERAEEALDRLRRLFTCPDLDLAKIIHCNIENERRKRKNKLRKEEHRERFVIMDNVSLESIMDDCTNYFSGSSFVLFELPPENSLPRVT